MAKTPKTTSETPSKVTTLAPTQPAQPFKARRKKLAGWTEHTAPKKDSFWTSDDYAAYPMKKGGFRAYALDDNGALGRTLGEFPSLEAITESGAE